MHKENGKKIFFVVLCAFIFLFLSINCDATTSSAPVAGIQMLSGGSGGSAPAPNGIAVDGGAATPIGSITPGLFNGALIYSSAIEAPKGRHGMTPDLALTYSSSNGNGWVGVGWDLEVGAIERSARFGVDFNGDVFILRKSGSAIELVADTTSGLYHAKIEGAFNRIKKLSASDGRTYWEVTDKTGVRYLYGQTAASRQDDPLNANNIFKWCLAQVIDTNGNFLSLSYFKDNGQIYLDRIDYTGHLDKNGTTDQAPTNYVKFYRESRTDAPDMYTTNFKVNTAYRLKSIDINANGNRVRAYALSYIYSGGTTRSVLTSLQQFDKNATVTPTGAVTGTALPAQSFQMQPSITYSTSRLITGYTLTSTPTMNLTGDFDGNGKSDILTVWTTGEGTASVYLNSLSNYSNTNYTNLWINSNSQKNLLGDFDGNGKTDILDISSTGQGNASVHVNYSTGSGFNTQLYSNLTLNTNLSMNLLGDFNGDGKTDVVDVVGNTDSYGNWQSGACYNLYTTACTTPTLIDTCNYDTSSAYTCPTNSVKTCNDVTNDYYDAGSDIETWNYRTVYCGNYTGPSWSTAYVNYATGNGFNTVQYSLVTNPAPGMNLVGDFNGDGKSDIVAITATGQGTASAYVNYSTGNGFNSVQYTGLTLNSNPAMNLVGDFNGDGKADIMAIWSTGQGNAVVYINYSTGSGFNTVQYTNLTLNGTASQNILGDFNGDGLTDILDIVASGQEGNASVYMNFSTGHGFNTINFAGLSLVGSVISGDFNGDGQRDLWALAITGQGTGAVFQNTSYGWLDLLYSISNGLGGTTTISYSPSTQYANTQLPFPLQTVSSVTTNDGNGISSQTSYAYSGGFFHIGERDFRGFNYAKVTGPQGPQHEQKIVETWFHQGNDIAVEANDDPTGPVGYMKGKPYRTRVSDVSGSIYSETTTSYASQPAGTTAPPYFNPPYQADTYNCDGKSGTSCAGGSSAQHVQITYTYDQYGNVTSEYRSGDLNDPTDTSARTLSRSYLPNTTAWILNLPANEAIYSGATGSRVASTDFYYDGSTSHTPATTGNLTQIVRWLDGVNDPKVQMTYDPYGNLHSIMDANGNSSTLAYDTSTNTFPAVATNALTQITTVQYYAGTPADSGLYGQVQSIIDPNGAATTLQYDTFGRKTKATAPDGTWAGWTYPITPGSGTSTNVFGTVQSQNIQIDTSAGLSTWSYFDGLGRTIIEKKSGPSGKIVTTTTSYNATGNVAQNSLPYFDGASGNLPVAKYTYDSLGRLVSVANPDGTSMSGCYYNGVTDVLDANQNRKRYIRNSQGRLVKIEEYEGTYNNCTTDVGTPYPYAATLYQYDALGNLLLVADAENNQTKIVYDALGRKVSMQDPDMGNWTYGYDANGNLKTQTDAKTQTITFIYDALNRVTKKTYPDTTFVSYTYDVKPDLTATTYPIGRFSTMTDASGSTKYFYDKMGRPSTVKKTVNGTEYTVSTGYDNGGRLASLKYPDGEIVGYGYDGGGNLNQVLGADSYGGWQSGACYHLYTTACTASTLIDTCDSDTSGAYTCPTNTVKICNDVANVYYDAGSDIETWNYRTISCGAYGTYSNFNALGQPSNVTFGNGVISAYQFDSLNNRLASLITSSPTATLLNLSYGYDNGGNVTSTTDKINSTRSQTLYYDDLNRLVQVQSASFGAQPVLAYFYDQIGNITYKEGLNYSYSDSTGKRPHAVKTTSPVSIGPIYTITATAGSGGTITPSGTASVYSGANQTVTITPNVGYKISDVLVDGVSVGAVGAYDFANVAANHTISASFTTIGNAGVSQLTAGYEHTVVVTSSGTLWAWGLNSYGQLGDGTSVNRVIPTHLGTDANWKTVAAGSSHSLAVKSGGTLWAWGYNGWGQLGDGTTVNKTTPIQIGTDTKWKTVAAADYHTAALKSDGTLWAWGYNGYGQLGDGTTVNKTTPIQIGTDTKWISVAAGWNHTAAVKSDGTLWAWGYNSVGQLGDGTTVSKTTPVQIGTDTKWISVAAGDFHTVAVKSDGTLWAWGYNQYGQLGDGTTVNKTTPVQIGTDTTWVLVAPGYDYTVAVKSDGVWAWGNNHNGQLGDGTTVDKFSPIPVVGFAQYQYPLIVTKSGTGAGTITSSPSGITCGSICNGRYYPGATITLTASPDTSSTFLGWTGACSDTGPCTLTMNAANTVEAVFMQNTQNAQTKIYTYDENGNMTSDGQRTITYNYDNLPATVTFNNATTTFVYDGMGNRVMKIGSSNNATVYIGKLYECYVGGGCSKYIFAGGTRIANKISSAADTLYYNLDHLGSTRIVSNAGGNIFEDIYYYPFGAAQSDAQISGSMKHKYTSQEFDNETGLYNYNARLYNPSLGRFISADSIVPDPSNPQSLNRYSYVLNNPTIYTDPTGHGACFYIDPTDPCDYGGGTGGGDGGGSPNPGMGGGTGGGGGGTGGGGGSVGVKLPGVPGLPTTITSVGAGDGVVFNNIVQYINQSISLPETGLFSDVRDYYLDRGFENIRNGNDGIAAFVDWAAGNFLYSMFNPSTILDIPLILMPIGELPSSVKMARGIEGYQAHHLLPQSPKLAPFFERGGLNIEEYQVHLATDAHILKPNGLHTVQGGNWNAVWTGFFEEYPYANDTQILQNLDSMVVQYNIPWRRLGSSIY